MAGHILRIAVPSPLAQTFDYLALPDWPVALLQPGIRIRVPFGRQRRVGVLLELASSSAVPASRLKTALEILDPQPLLNAEQLQLARWASAYYHYPIGEVIAAQLPLLLRQGGAAPATDELCWRLTAAGAALAADNFPRAVRQAKLWRLLKDTPAGVAETALRGLCRDWRALLRLFEARGWARAVSCSPAAEPIAPVAQALPLNRAQAAAVTAVLAALDGFQAFVLEGVTGSGKTEVYLHLIAAVIARGRQVLVLVPEIGLTPQLISRFRARLTAPLVVLHSDLAEGARAQAWLQARAGQARVILGTRSALFAPLAAPGLIIIDEEHDLSFKQQDGFRYHARDLALMRAKHCGIPVLLGSATPSLETLYNVQSGRYRALCLPERAGGAVAPAIEVLDVRQRRLQQGLSEPLLQRLEQCLQSGGQALVFLNRRGYAPTLLCHQCGWVAQCQRCDARLVVHQRRGLLLCHHCAAQRQLPVRCPQCAASELRALGQGTQRLEQFLARRFPAIEQVRIDRDSTRRKGSLEELLARVHTGQARLLIGTQMLAKGHHFPDVSLAAIVDVDHGLFGADFRAAERMAQLIVQVAGRAGRAERRGHVLLQTHNPDHPLLRRLISGGYAAFATAALAERRAANLPPFTSLALLRAEAPAAATAMDFLTQAQALIDAPDEVAIFGPMPAPMARRGGRQRAQLLLQADQRAALQQILHRWLPQLTALKSARKVRWSLDVDPMETL